MRTVTKVGLSFIGLGAGAATIAAPWDPGGPCGGLSPALFVAGVFFGGPLLIYSTASFVYRELKDQG